MWGCRFRIGAIRLGALSAVGRGVQRCIFSRRAPGDLDPQIRTSSVSLVSWIRCMECWSFEWQAMTVARVVPGGIQLAITCLASGDIPSVVDSFCWTVEKND